MSFVNNSSELFNRSQTYMKQTTICYCNHYIFQLFKKYSKIHGHLSLAICIIGISLNSFNIFILTKQQFRMSPINDILRMIAIVDALVMIDYLPFSYLIINHEFNYKSYYWAVFLLFHTHFSQILHTVSIWLTLMLAFWRYSMIKSKNKSETRLQMNYTKQSILITFIVSSAICSPLFFLFSINETIRHVDNEKNITLYHLGLSKIANKNQELLYYISLWIYAVFIKLIPCIILSIFTVWLIRILWIINKRKRRTVQKQKLYKWDKKTKNMTRILIAILILFLITEFPQGILALLSGLLGKCFFQKCYNLFGDIMDLFALVNGTINFFLYCFLNTQFRLALKEMFHC